MCEILTISKFIAQEEIFSSSYAAAAYLKSISFAKKAYIIGGAGIQEELSEVGIPSRGVEEHAQFIKSFDEAQRIQIDPEIGAVVVGIDLTICYYKVAYASLTHPQK